MTASQPFSTIIVTFIYSAFFTTYIVEDVDKGTLLWTSYIHFAIIAAILSPILGAIADRNSSRKLMLIVTTYMYHFYWIAVFQKRETMCV